MSAKVYILFEAIEGKCAAVVHALRRMPGVIVAEEIEGPPDVVMIVEALNRQKLAELAMSAVASVENLATVCDLLPTRDSTVLNRVAIRQRRHSRRAEKNSG